MISRLRGSNSADRGLRIAIGHRVLDRIVERGLAAGAIDVGQDLALLDHLAAHGRHRLVVGAPVNEADYREVRQQRKQPREQGDPERVGTASVLAAYAASM